LIRSVRGILARVAATSAGSADVSHRGRTIAAAAFFFACLLLSSALAPAQEIVLGGQATFVAGITGNWDDPLAISPFARVMLGPDLAVFADTAEMRATGSLTRSFPGAGDSVEGSIDTIELRLYPADWLTLDLGLLRHQPGAAILLSPVNYLMPIAVDLGAGGELPATAGSAALIGVTTFIGGGYLSAHVVPAPAAVSLPEVASDILGGVSLMSVLDDPDGGGSLARADFALGTTQGISNAWRRSSFGIEAGAAVGPVDLTVLYFHGLDRIPTVVGEVDTRSVPAGEFALSLSPAESVIDALGVSAQTAVGPAMFWLDGSYVIGRSFGTTTLVPTETAGLYDTETIVAPHVELVAGGLIQIFQPELRIAAEYRHGFIGSDRTDIIRLDFPGTALLSLTADFADGFVSATAAGVALIPDRSGVVIGSVTLSPSSELSAYIQAPIVVAAEESLLGGLRSLLSISAGVTYRF
jgi:hypothetical protein